MNFYISPSGNDSTGSGTLSAPWKTLTKAFSVGGAGQTYILMDGAYNYAGCEIDQKVKSGSASAYTIIKAQNDGKAVISVTNGLQFPATDATLKSYVQVEGLKFTGTYSKGINGSYIKLLRCGIEGGCSSGNCTSLSVGGNDYSTPSHHILLEDCWIYGPGGRYKVLIFNSEKVIARRIVARHDGGWTDSKGDPEAVFALYNSSECLIQDCILLDNVGPAYHTFGGYGAFYLIRNQSATPDHPSFGNVIRGLMVLDTINTGFLADAKYTNVQPFNKIVDSVIVNPKGYGMSWGSNDESNMIVDRVAVVRKGMTGAGANTGGLGYWGSGGAIKATNLIVAGFGTGKDMQGINASYFDTFGNGSSSTGTGRKTFDPFINGMLYPVRVEPGVGLWIGGAGGNGLGPNIVTKWGVSGTLHGEPGYDTDTGERLWPWPNQDRIKADMSIIKRGWTSGAKSLTRYVWEFLGNAIPAEIEDAAPAPVPTPPPLPTIVATVEHSTIEIGKLTNLSWTSTGADTVTINGQPADSVNGTITIAPTASKIYTFEASGPGGKAVAQVSVTVLVPAPPPPPPPPPQPAQETVGQMIGHIREYLDKIEQKAGSL